MRLRQVVRVNVSRPGGGEETLLKTARSTLRSRLLRRFVGDQYAVLVLWGISMRYWCSRRSACMWMRSRFMNPKQTIKKGKPVMEKMDSLRAGVAEMRSVAQRLNQWADDLEASFRDQEADAKEVPASGESPAEKEEGAAVPAGNQPAAVKEERKALTLPEVRAILAAKCAAGFGTQVKALIESYGATSLKGVPVDRYGELLEAVSGLGGDADAG